MSRVIPDEVAAEVVTAYQAGEKVSSIVSRTGVPHATVYWCLERAGVTPSRLKRRSNMRMNEVQAADLFDAIAEQEEMIAALEEEIRTLREQLRGQRQA